MFEIKCYLYDSGQERNGYRGTDYSAHILQGSQYKGDITQVLDTGELTLNGLPFIEEFAPQTKFIIDIVEDGVVRETLHFCVQRDTVDQPILSDEHYFNHHLSLIEPSVIAQQRLVDNIAATYKLKDVTLEVETTYPSTDAAFANQSSQFTPLYNFGKRTIQGFDYDNYYYGKYFAYEGRITAIGKRENPDSHEIEDFDITAEYTNTTTLANNQVRFRVPQLAIYMGRNGTKAFDKIGYASLSYTIQEFELDNPSTPTRTWSGQFISNSNLSQYTSDLKPGATYASEWLPETIAWERASDLGNANGLIIDLRKYTNVSAGTPTYETQTIDIRPEHQYTVTLSPYYFTGATMNKYADTSNFKVWRTATSTNIVSLCEYSWEGIGDSLYVIRTQDYFSQAQTNGVSTYKMYELLTHKIIYNSSVPYSALALLQKAILNTGIYEKKDGVYIGDTNENNMPIYIDNEFVQELATTKVIENFYNQKNLWEVMVEVGNYIHAIPELRFGADDKFMITFNRLGNTEQSTDNGTKVSIFNSRSVEDYISATSSYITNMVQLGGNIEEWVVPKTTDDTLLVSNDTASLLVSKPIIELLEVTVERMPTNDTEREAYYNRVGIPVGAPRDMTPYIFEENVYKTLGIDINTKPNRGIAMYYKLGTNEITGGNYRLPTEQTGDVYNDYTFKKVIYSAFFGYPYDRNWGQIVVSDFKFKVKYRTKDDVRQNHARPDLRKYLVNSKYDKIPEHNQFNNQTDVVVDSIKFGTNIYGKLIRTGNNTYEKREWTDKWENVKHKGELYKINGELYYVANVEIFVFSTYISSVVSFSKDYNELSNIIGIPSEPRFYEISEQSLIWREFAINDILLLSEKRQGVDFPFVYENNYVFNYQHLLDLIFGENTDFARYAISVFKGDKDVVRYVDDQATGEPNNYIEVMNPINAYSSGSTLTYEWDMRDNYAAGDKVIPTPLVIKGVGDAKDTYKTLRAVPYTDIYGKAALYDFYVLSDIGTPTAEQIKAFPESPIKTRNDDPTDTRPFIRAYSAKVLATNVFNLDDNYNGRGIGLLKDCREAMSINYNLQLITTSDTFVTSSFVFSPFKKNLRLVLLNTEVNKLTNGYIDIATIIAPKNAGGVTLSPYFDFLLDKAFGSRWNGQPYVGWGGIQIEQALSEVSPLHFTGGNDDYTRVKAIALICDVSATSTEDGDISSIENKKQFVIARNIDESFTRAEALKDWWIGAPSKNIFRNRQ